MTELEKATRMALEDAVETIEALLPSKDDENHDGHDARDVRKWRSMVSKLKALTQALATTEPTSGLTACTGTNCGCTDGVNHSLECHAEHAAAIAGGKFVPGETKPTERKGEPVAWVLTRQLERRETTTRGYLWFSDPKNACWTPLYTSPQVPEGFALVPVEPTPEMLKAMENQWLIGSQVDMAKREYAAMLDAAREGEKQA